VIPVDRPLDLDRRSRLGLEPSAAASAFGLGNFDVHAELTAACVGAKVDDEAAAYWAAQWCRGWDRRFKSR
jgi:hypothetical protein